MKPTLTFLTALLLAPLAALLAAEPVSLSADHTAIVNHQRRVFFQYDPAADIQRKGGFGSDMDAVMSYVFDAASRPGSQLDAICIDVSNEGVAHYRSKILPAIQHPGLMKWREQGLDYFDELIKQGHKRGKEIWWGLRMNEVERGDLAVYDIKAFANMKERNPVKAAHPEWLIRSWWWQGVGNYAVKEVRDYRLSIVREVAEQYDFDGVHLDFLRHTPFLPPGRQWENREHLTSFMRDVRSMLQSQAAKRGRPFLLAARVPDSVEGCHKDGLDIETWAREGLVDVLILGTRTIKVDVDSFRKAMAGAPVKLMPSFDCFHATDGYHGDQSLDLVCGVFGNYLHQGADGVGAFNGIIGFPEQAKKLGLTQTDTSDLQVFSTIGSLTTISDKARYYPMDRRGGYQGTYLQPKGEPIANLAPPSGSSESTRAAQRDDLDLLAALNRPHLKAHPAESDLDARIASFELAFRMQTQAPEVFDLAGEPEPVRKAYGLDAPHCGDFARQCITARRLVERGVRFVQLYSGGSENQQSWDCHANLRGNHGAFAAEFDQPIAALLCDLEQRGLLESTLVIWGGEFGRLPTAQKDAQPGRDHNPHGFTIWMAGAGVKPGVAYGATDEFGHKAAVDKVHIHDLHATWLHLLGVDHEKLTYRFNGRDFRLTDVHGEVVQAILA